MTKPKKAKLPDVWVVWFGPRPEAYTDRADAKLAAFNKIEPKRYALYQKPKTCRWEIRSGKHLGRVWRTACLASVSRSEADYTCSHRSSSPKHCAEIVLETCLVDDDQGRRTTAEATSSSVLGDGLDRTS